jgi:uncharacterized protein (TIGR03492 family)
MAPPAGRPSSQPAVSAPRKLLIISNGHGEDAIAAQIVRRLPPGFAVEAYPTLGDGRAYAGVCPIVGPRAQLPSEGWRNVKHSVARDISGGGIATIWPGLRFIRAARDSYDRVLIVGDMIGVYGCWVTGHRAITYLDVYKTGFGRGYLGVDKLILRRTARTVFCRAAPLADQLKAAGIDARAAGNVMMDTIPRTGLSLPRSRPLGLTILPGSRAHATANFALQAAALAKLPAQSLPDLFLAVAASIDIDQLGAAANLRRVPDATGLGRLQGGSLDILLVPGAALGDALDASDLVLSQAGTATVQAIGLGRPSITFQTETDRPSRFRDESRLFGDARSVVAADPDAIAAALSNLLTDPTDRTRRSTTGRERIGPPGAIGAIIAELGR